MSFVLWILIFFWFFFGLVYWNARVRKQVIIAATYISLTGWYYYRQWEKSRHPERTSSSYRLKSPSSSKQSNVPKSSDSDVRYFESPANSPPRPSSEYDGRSRTSFSSSSEDLHPDHPPKSHLGIFRKWRKSHRRSIEQSPPPSISSSTSEILSVSISSSSITSPKRRVFSGRKKPATWGE